MPAEKHESFPRPTDPSVKLWRYMDLSKFVALLQGGALHFARADCLGDPFEGSVPVRNSGEFLKDELLRNPELAKHVTKDGMTLEQIGQMRAMISEGRRRMLTSFYCSCWHMSEHESAAMWRLYSQARESICVQTTFEKLEDALPSWTFVGVVRYADFEREVIDEGNLFNPIMTKRKSYEHEREVRAVAWSLASKETGGQAVADALVGNVVKVGVDLSKLVERVYVSPASPDWFRDVVAGLLNSYGLAVQIRQSALDDKPLF